MPEMSSKIFIRMQIFFTKNQTNTLNQNLTVYAFMQNPNRTLLNPLKKFCGDMLTECKIAEKKAPSNNEVLLRSTLLKAQIHANWIGNLIKSQHKTAMEYYDQALSLVEEGDTETEALIRYRYGMFCAGSKIAGKDKAIQNLKRAMEIVGEDSEHGIECAKEIAKLEEKQGGCFIATAVYGSYYAPEVLVLRQFRDKVLSKFFWGRVFIKLYYAISPFIAERLDQCQSVKKILRNLILNPIIKNISDSKGGHKNG